MKQAVGSIVSTGARLVAIGKPEGPSPDGPELATKQSCIPGPCGHGPSGKWHRVE